MQSTQAKLDSIKQQIISGPNFADRFLQIISNAQNQTFVAKESVLQFIELFYENNAKFVQTFEQAFLYIFKNYSETDGRTFRFIPNITSQGFESLLNLFIVEMINMEFQVQKSSQQQAYFESFVDFYVSLFAQGLTSAKSLIKQFCFSVLISSLKTIEEFLELQLLPETRQTFLDSIIYLIASKFQDHKRMGIQLYSVCSKLGIKSDQIQEILFEQIESLQNFSLRKMIIQWGISIDKPRQLNRILNRLKDKNPLIAEQVIDKLIKEEIQIQFLTFQQKIKLLVDGFGSHFQNVKKKALEYFSKYFIISLEKQSMQIQTNQPEKQNLDVSTILGIKKQSGLQKFIRNFAQNSTGQIENIFCFSPFLQALMIEMVTQMVFFSIPFALVEKQILQIFNNFETNQTNFQELLFICSICSGMASKKQKKQKRYSNQVITKFESLFSKSLPSAMNLMSILKGLMRKNKDTCQQLASISLLIRMIGLIAVQIDFYDYVGKRTIEQEMKILLIESQFFNDIFDQKRKDYEIQTNFMSNKDNQSDYCLLKMHSLIYPRSNLSAKNRLQIVIHQWDLIRQIVQVIISIQGRKSLVEDLGFKILIDELLLSKQLKFQREMMRTMLEKTSCELKNVEDSTQEVDIRLKNKLNTMNEQIQKKILTNQKSIKNNHLKALFILTSVLSFKNINQFYDLPIKTSDYLDLIKLQLQKAASPSLCKFDKAYQDIASIPYILVYFTCLQSEQNFIAFKKLFEHYAFESKDRNTEEKHTQIISTHILSELRLKFKSAVQKDEHKLSKKKFLQQVWKKLSSNSNKSNSEQRFYKQLILKHICSDISSPQTQQNPTSYTSHLLSKLVSLQIVQTLSKDKFSDEQTLFSKLLSVFLLQCPFSQSINKFECILTACLSFRNFINQMSVKDKAFQMEMLSEQIVRIIYSHLKIASLNTPNIALKHRLQTLVITFKLLKILSYKVHSYSFVSRFRPTQLIGQFISSRQTPSRQQQELQISRQLDIRRQIDIQFLIYVKSQVQGFAEYVKTKNQPGVQSLQVQFVYFSQQLCQINQILEEQISKRFFSADCTNLQQQSTDNSPPISIVQSVPLEQNSIGKRKIDVQKIQGYDKIIQKRFKNISKQAQNISKEYQSSAVYEILYESWIIIHKGSTDFINEHQNHQSSCIKIENSSKIINFKNQQNNSLKRHGTTKSRKVTLPEKNFQSEQQDINLCTASIKRSRFIIIPYEVIEKVENQRNDDRKVSKKYIKHSNKHDFSKNDGNFYVFTKKRQVLTDGQNPNIRKEKEQIKVEYDTRRKYRKM